MDTLVWVLMACVVVGTGVSGMVVVAHVLHEWECEDYRAEQRTRIRRKGDQ